MKQQKLRAGTKYAKRLFLIHFFCVIEAKKLSHATSQLSLCCLFTSVTLLAKLVGKSLELIILLYFCRNCESPKNELSKLSK